MNGAGSASRDTGLPEGAHPLLRLLPLARPVRGRLLLAVLAAAAATGCGVALLGTSGFLLARASQHPSILAISGAVVAVRAFSVGRGVFRYAERVSSHDAAGTNATPSCTAKEPVNRVASCSSTLFFQLAFPVRASSA